MTNITGLSIRVIRYLASVIFFTAALQGTASAAPFLPVAQEPTVIHSRPADEPPSFRVTSIHQWIVDWMIGVSPPGVNFYEGAKETEAEAKRRYEDIADSVISVAYDESEKPLFGGKYGRAMTAALLVSIAFNESSFRKDVDLNIGPEARGDAGSSWCLVQINLGRPIKKTGKTDTRIVFDGQTYRLVKDKLGLRGWGGEDLVKDRQKCFRAGLRIARMSFGVCRKQDLKYRLANYASGDGTCTLGREASEIRVKTAQSWLAKKRPPLLDEEVLNVLRLGPPTVLPMPPGSRVSVFSPIVIGGIVLS